MSRELSRASRWVALGAAAGFLISLALSLVMPSRYVATADVTMRPGSSFTVPRDAGYTPRVQLYGGMGPQYERAILMLSAAAPTGTGALARVKRRVRSFAEHAPAESSAIRTVRSPSVLRDVALGMLAGALVALALLLVMSPNPRRRWPAYSK